MFEAQLLIAKDVTPVIVYSPWFPRNGDYMLATADVVDVAGATLEVEVLTKNTEDTGDGIAVAGLITASVIGRTPSAEFTLLKELVRYKFEVTGSEGNWILFRMLPPSWFDRD